MKGVGAVVLGVVIRGKVEKHMTMRVIPGDKACRSDPYKRRMTTSMWLFEGDRVGLGLKNVEVEEIERGTVLTSDAQWT